MKEPTPYDGNNAKFVDWRDSLHSHLASHDQQFVERLLWIEKLGRNSLRLEDMIELAQDLRLTASDIIDAKNTLYTLLCNYTGGNVRK